MIYGILAVSVLANAILIWYGRRLVIDLADLSLEVEGVITDLNVYHRHVEQVYQLETFHGDETLRALLKHSKAVSERVGEFTTLFSRIEGEEVLDGIGEQIDGIEEQTDSTEEQINGIREESEEQVSQEKKHVFYAGARRRNT
jgi:hypothetical protein